MEAHEYYGEWKSAYADLSRIPPEPVKTDLLGTSQDVSPRSRSFDIMFLVYLTLHLYSVARRRRHQHWNYSHQVLPHPVPHYPHPPFSPEMVWQGLQQPFVCGS